MSLSRGHVPVSGEETLACGGAQLADKKLAAAVARTGGSHSVYTTLSAVVPEEGSLSPEVVQLVSV